ncbi:hypothetical protein [Desulfocastanea catecholica]
MQQNPRSSPSISERLTKWYRDRQTETQLIEYLVETVEPKIRTVSGYRRRLRIPLRICLQHCKAMVAQIPGPIHLTRSNYYSDPLIKAAFVGSTKIEDLLASPEAQMVQHNRSDAQRFALLTMTSTEKTIFGPKKQGEMIVGDAAMQTITFTDHKIVGLGATLESSRDELEKLSLEVIAEATAGQLAARKSHLAEVRHQHESLRAMSRMFGGGSRARSVFGVYNLEEQEKLKKIEHLLKETELELAAVSKEIEAPKDRLAMLESSLSTPEKILAMRRISLRLDWKNVITPDAEEEAQAFTLAHFSLTDKLQREGVLIAYEQR